MSSRRILIIDDEPDIRAIVGVSLELTAGWDVIDAPDGLSGVQIAHEQRPDLILLDLMMPGCDGLSTLRQLRVGEFTATLPVILMTATPLRVARLDAVDGAQGVIAKPFDPMTLADRIREIAQWA